MTNGRNGRRPRPTTAWMTRRNPWFWIFAGFLILVFFTGGSSRANVLSLPVLRPLAAIALCAALAAVRLEDLKAHRFLVAFAALATVAVLIQLIPLPPATWSALPHRELPLRAVQSAGLYGEWHPLSLSPTGTRNAAYSLLVPLATLALGLCVGPADRQRMLWLLLALGGVAVLLGALQITTSPNMAFYLYRLSTPFVPNGFFANPNHNAAFMAGLLPMVAFAASGIRGEVGRVPKELIVSMAAALVIVLIILLAGSRAGAVLALIGIAAMPLARRQANHGTTRRTDRRVFAGIAISLVAIVAIALMFGRAAAIHRVVAGDAVGDLRLRVWPIIAKEAFGYFPAGSGWGSFVEAFQIVEPYQLLKPTYLNHAHNDWLEVMMTGGAVGLALLLAVAIGWLIALLRMRHVARHMAAIGWTGLATLLILGLSSLVDYPLRTPCLQALFILACLWVGDALNVKRPSVSEADPLAAQSSINGTR